MIKLTAAFAWLLACGISVQFFPLWEDWIYLSWLTVLVVGASWRSDPRQLAASPAAGPRIEDGWRFQSADFSVQAGGGDSAPGSVMLVRCPADVARWHELTAERTEHVPLYVMGGGMTLDEAISNANLEAAHAVPIDA